MRITVIDGHGGRLGQSLVERIVSSFPEADLTAVGINGAATQAMIKGGATKAATGENAVIVACRNADVIVAPLGVAIADSMLGEVSPAIARAVGTSRAFRILIPMNLCDTYVPGVNGTASELIQDAMDQIRRRMVK